MPTASNEEEYKRIQRTLSDLLRRLDNASTSYVHVSSVFATDVSFLRTRLRDYVQKLWNLEPLEWGIGAMDLYWRKALYEPYTQCRSLRVDKEDSVWTETEAAYVRSHLLQGLAHFHQFIDKIQDVAGTVNINQRLAAIDFHGQQDVYGYMSSGVQLGPAKSSRGRDLKALQDWRLKATHRCLIALGDISRYLLEFIPSPDLNLPKHYYLQAFKVDPANGMPFNQIAALASANKDGDFGLQACFYYLRSLTVETPFEGARGNLQKLLERNAKMFQKFQRDPHQRPMLEPDAETERCVVFHLELINQILFGHEYDHSGEKLTKTCHLVIQTLQNCLYLPMQHNQTDVVYLPKSVAYRLVLILLFSMELVLKQASRLSMIRAYLLALFSHFVTKLLGDIYLEVHGPEALIELFEPKKPQEQQEPPEEPKPSEEKPVMGKRKVNKLDQLMRRKRGGRKGHSRDNLSDNESDLSERGLGDSGSEETYNSSRCNSDTDELEDDETEDSCQHSADESDMFDEDSDEHSDSDVLVESTKDILSVMHIVKIVSEHHLLPALRICMLWLRKSPELVEEAGNSSDILFERLAKLFSSLSLKNSIYEPDEAVLTELQTVQEENLLSSVWFQEDFDLSGTKISAENKHEYQSGKFTLEKEMVQTRRAVLRLMDILSFRDWVCTFPEAKLIHDLSTDTVHIGSDLEIQDLISAREQEQEAKKPESIRRAQVMESMAQLWLQQEVQDLEGRVRKDETSDGCFSGFLHYSPYIVVDQFALSQNLKLVKEIVASKKLALIIPSAVIQELDNMKKAEHGARNAIKWLEKLFRDGNHWVRPQRLNESKPFSEFDTEEGSAIPKKKDKDWTFIKILECCHYFSTLRGSESSEEDDGKFFVTLLTVDKTEISSEKSMNAKKLAATKRICVEDIAAFMPNSKFHKKVTKQKGKQKTSTKLP